MLQKLKKSILAGETMLGTFMKTSDPAFVEIAGYAGFDFVILDMEHSPLSFGDIQNLIRAAIIAGTVPIVRTSDLTEISIARALDLGAYGVQIPQVRTAADARLCIEAARFSPLGARGVCRFVRAAGYSNIPRNDYFQLANETLLILQLEGQEALDNLDEILDVEGIDIIFIGPYDLSQSLGFPGQITHPEVIKKMKVIVDKAWKRNIVTGTFTDTIESLKMWKDAGVQYISYSVDVGIFMDACKSLIKKLQINNSLAEFEKEGDILRKI